MTTGIYRINGPHGCVYFGSAVNIEKRWKDHIRDLTDQRHHSDYMQRHYNKYGLRVFTFTIVEQVDDKSELLNTEQDYLDWGFRYLGPECRYNSCRVAGNSLGRRLSDDTRRKIAEAHKGKTLSAKHQHAFMSAAKEYNERKAKTYTFCSPTGEIVSITNLNKFCREHGYSSGNMRSVVVGKLKSAYGWTLPESTEV